jgi:outer membrane protein OmpA-like peptidoglycan-associated protein/tetratricopeptide (TPR) repeat protein
MKKYRYFIVSIAVLMLIPQFAISQRSKMTLAEKFYQSFEYRTAAGIYRDVLSNAKYANDTIALRRIADCERKLGNLVSAEGYYKQLLKQNNANKEDMRALAEVLKFQAKYSEAVEIYQKTLEKFPDDDIAKRYVENPNFANEILRDSAIYTIINSPVNSSECDFGPGIFASGKIVFSSARNPEQKDERIYTRNEQPYLNVYMASLGADSTLQGAEKMSDKINSRYHEGTMTYDPGNNLMYLTRNNYVRGAVQKSKTGRTNLGIYVTKYESGEMSWGNLEKFPHNNKEYNVGHPALNSTGTKMYFTSDMPGGAGGTDLYYCEKEGEKWGSPKNMGPKYNTSGDEMFPFVIGDTTLYFSSTGHVGLGGLDVFYTSMNDDLPVRNMGYPANSHFDDFSLVSFPDELVGYLGSNRAGGKGDDDIYIFKLHPVDSILVSGLVTDALTLEPIANAIVSVPTDDGTIVQVKTDSQGRYIMKAPYKSEILLEANKQGYRPGQVTRKANARTTTMENMNIAMEKIDYMANGKVLYEENDAPATGALVRLFELSAQDTLFVDSVLIGSLGTYNFYLEKNKNYLLEATKQDYARQTHRISTNDPNNKVHTHDFRLFKAKVGEVVRLDNIYYDYKKWDIRPDAAKELNKLVQILIDNPTMKIELGSHSDARGSDQYNLDLSDKRAKSAAAYIISQGIAADRLYGKGYGESLILNHCKNDVKCTDEEHQYNRRTEFKITSF